METPKGITYTPIYEPDEERMVKALKIVLDITPQKDQEKKSEESKDE